MRFRVRIFENVGRHHSQIERRAAIDPRNDVGRGIEMDRQGMAAGLFEWRAEFLQKIGDGAASNHFQFGGLRSRSRQHCQSEQQGG